MKASLLIEIQTEELPPKALKTLSMRWRPELRRGLLARVASCPSESVVTAYGSPRRLADAHDERAKNVGRQVVRQKLLPVAFGLRLAGQGDGAHC